MNIKKLVTKVVHQIKSLVMYSVHSHDYNKQHFAWTLKDAFNWMACYHEDDFVVISTAGRMVAIRGV